eukprot:g1849.t1
MARRRGMGKRKKKGISRSSRVCLLVFVGAFVLVLGASLALTLRSIGQFSAQEFKGTFKSVRGLRGNDQEERAAQSDFDGGLNSERNYEDAAYQERKALEAEEKETVEKLHRRDDLERQRTELMLEKQRASGNIHFEEENLLNSQSHTTEQDPPDPNEELNDLGDDRSLNDEDNDDTDNGSDKGLDDADDEDDEGDDGVYDDEDSDYSDTVAGRAGNELVSDERVTNEVKEDEDKGIDDGTIGGGVSSRLETSSGRREGGAEEGDDDVAEKDGSDLDTEGFRARLHNIKEMEENIGRDEDKERYDSAGSDDLLALKGGPFASTSAVLVICYNRPKYLQRTLGSLLDSWPEEGASHRAKLFVSQDGNDARVSEVIRTFSRRFSTERNVLLNHLHHTQKFGRNGYEKLAQHFGFALGHLFDKEQLDRVIIVEDDLEVAPDFLEYFAAMAPLLEKDDTIMAVSAWNDNGFPKFAQNSRAVVRSDYFPGLGWMLDRKMWLEWGPKWPKGYWDDWLREPPQRRGRVTLRPEISRTHTFGRNGVSRAQFFDRYLSPILLNHDSRIHWLKPDASLRKMMVRLTSKAAYDADLLNKVN